MTSKYQNYDISLSNNDDSNQTELVNVKNNNSNSELTSSTEYEENNDNSEDFTELKHQFNNSVVVSNPLVKKKETKKKIKYRKGNLHTFFYDENGLPRIVIGPDWGTPYACIYSLFQ